MNVAEIARNFHGHRRSSVGQCAAQPAKRQQFWGRVRQDTGPAGFIISF